MRGNKGGHVVYKGLGTLPWQAGFPRRVLSKLMKDSWPNPIVELLEWVPIKWYQSMILHPCGCRIRGKLTLAWVVTLRKGMEARGKGDSCSHRRGKEADGGKEADVDVDC